MCGIAPPSPPLISSQVNQPLSGLLGLRTKRLKWNKVPQILPGMMSSSRPKAWMSELLFFPIRSLLSAQGRRERQAQLRCTAWGARDPDPGSGWGGRRRAARPGAQGLSGFRQARPGAALPASPWFLPPPVTPRPLPKYVPFPPSLARHPAPVGTPEPRGWHSDVARPRCPGPAPPGAPLQDALPER